MPRLAVAVSTLAVAAAAGGWSVAGGGFARACLPPYSWIDEANLVSPGFGFVVASRRIDCKGDRRTTERLVAYRDGSWDDVTPRLRGRFISDVVFADRSHGWLLALDCLGRNVTISLYRTVDGGQSWRVLDSPTSSDCIAGLPTLEFADPAHGWLAVPRVRGNATRTILGSDDAGESWTKLTSSLDPGGSLLCETPMEFASPKLGWTRPCSRDSTAYTRLLVTRDGGRGWSGATIRVPHGANERVYAVDFPVFADRRGVVAATVGRFATATSISFLASRDAGRRWSVRSTRDIAPCDLDPSGHDRVTIWPAAVASARVWWVVGGGPRVTAQVTSDAGRHWRSVTANGLRPLNCVVSRVTAADARTAWVIARTDGDDGTGLFETHDGGRTWRRAPLPLG